MIKQFAKKLKFFICLLFMAISFFSFPGNIFAKELTLSSSSVDVEVDKTIEIKVSINTDSDKVSAIGFGIDFSTELLEGLTPNQNGSAFPMCATLSSTKYECGATGQNGFSGSGTVTTLLFKGRKAGTTTITLKNIEARYGPNGDEVTGFSANSIDLSVWGVGQAPIKKSSSSQTNSNSSSSDSGELPAATFLPSSSKPQAELSTPGQSLGSTPQVPGKIGSSSEEPLKVASEEDGTANASVKGLFSKSNQVYLSLIPTILLLAVAIFFGLRLYGTEKKRHIEMERLFDRQLGMLSALESKMDLVEQKGEGGREKFMQEFEQAKSEIKSLESEPEKQKNDQSAPPLSNKTA